jgi:hypothetical protein
MPGHRHTYHATALRGHKVDYFRGNFFSGAEQIALIFTIFIIDQHNHLTGPEVFQHIVYTAKTHLNYLPHKK